MRFLCILFLIFGSPLFAASVDATIYPNSFPNLKTPANRIVSLAPHITELIFAAGAGSKLVGAVRESDYPAEAKKIPIVGDAYGVDYEQIMRLKPDLIIGWRSGNKHADLERLQQLRYNLLITEQSKLSDIAQALRDIGKLAGTEAIAQRHAADFMNAVESIRNRYGKLRSVSVFYQLWHTPLMTVNGKHMISDVLSLCAGKNIFAVSGFLTPTIDTEAVLAKNPDVIIAATEATDIGFIRKKWTKYEWMIAVRKNTIYGVDPDLIHRQTPRIIQGAQLICQNLDEARRRLN